MPPSLDLFAVPLARVQLIEASAGTGKTWTLCGLYVRLLLEKRLRVRDILVVTFTKAATAELKDRIRERLAVLRRGLAAGAGATADSFAADVLTRLRDGDVRDLDVAQARSAVNRAIAEFDEAAIYTIHGFCQRALTEVPFAAGLPFRFEVIEDDTDAMDRAAADFCRNDIAAGKLDLHALRLLRARLTPVVLARNLRSRLGRPLADYRYDATRDSKPFSDYVSSYEAARDLWTHARDGAIKALLDNLDSLRRSSYATETVTKSARAWDEFLASPFAGFPQRDAPLKYFAAGHMATQLKKGARLPSHAFFGLAQTLLDQHAAAEACVEGMRIGLLENFLQRYPEQVRADKRRRRLVGYDDMLHNLYQALKDPQRPWLASAIQRRYPAALIDEFQDTDPLQHAIFTSIYGAAEGPLYLIGDPKQAIYGFRHADIHTYLDAARQTGEANLHTLATNQRSTRGVIAAVNALFDRNERAFVLEGMRYGDVSPSERTRQAFRDPDCDASLVVWQLPRAEDACPIAQGDCERRAVLATASEIQRLLRGSVDGAVRVGDGPLEAHHIAVIVRTHEQARRIKLALRSAGIGAVERSQLSVFSTPEADSIAALLAALDEPAGDGLRNAVLATPLFGLNANQIDAEVHDDAKHAARLSRFLDYRDLWRKHGFAAMWRRLLNDERIAERLLCEPDGERQLTNTLHLAELVHHAALRHSGTDAVLRWYQRRRSETPDSEDAQLRLESDEKLVQIATVHASKGLEYAIVFCPFIWIGGSHPKEDATCAEYHDDGRVIVRYALDNAEAIKRQRVEEMAETVRLHYVALTRAIYRTYLAAGAYLHKKKDERCRTSALNWLMSGSGYSPESWLAAAGPELASVESAWTRFGAAHAPDVAVMPMPGAPKHSVHAMPDSTSSWHARDAERHLSETWRHASFTSLNASESLTVLAHEAVSADHDEGVAAPPFAGQPPADLADHDPMRFPRGAEAGSLLHAVFEAIDFSEPASWDGPIADAVARYASLSGFETSRLSSAVLAAILRRTIENVLGADLDGAGLRLREVPVSERLSELGFHFPVAWMDVARLSRTLAEVGLPAEGLSCESFSGYMRGAIDCVVRREGRYCLLDWKSNFLGWRPEDYGAAALERAMQEEGYHLQAAIYAVALHRYLRMRLPRYNPNRDFGGLIYLYVRGIRPDGDDEQGRPTGVWFRRLSGSQLELLDASFFAKATGGPA